MASAFRAKGRGAKLRYVAGLSAAERTALASVLGEVLQIVAPQALAQSEAPAPDAFGSIVAQLGPLGREPADMDGADERDRALDRLIPAAYREDDAVAAEFRRLTEFGIRERKGQGLMQAIAALRRSGPFALSPAEAARFATALTDARLVIADRLEITEEGDAEVLERELAEMADPQTHPLVHLVAMYDFLAWLQETLSVALLASVRTDS